jgi:hypothetical protein
MNATSQNMAVEIHSMTVTVPPGVYLLADPCYAVPADLWEDLLDSCNYFETPVGRVQGQQVLAFPTAHGDGSYAGSDGFTYGVDSGLIGLTPLALVPARERAQLSALGAVVNLVVATRCTWHEGLMTFGALRIDTRSEGQEVGEA